MKNSYEVIVGNVGSVYNGPIKALANGVYNLYITLSKRVDGGSASGEPVALLCDGEIVKEYIPDELPF